MLYYQIDEFAYDLNNDEILKYKICTRESVLKMNFIENAVLKWKIVQQTNMKTLQLTIINI